jgi:hypothetical protein
MKRRASNQKLRSFEEHVAACGFALKAVTVSECAGASVSASVAATVSAASSANVTRASVAQR